MLKVALSGIGEIALQQHVPVIEQSADWELAATCSRNGSVAGVEGFQDLDTMLRERRDIDVVSLCQPPVPRFQYALSVLQHKRHLMLEKPPGATLSQCLALKSLAHANRLSLFASWHSQEADAVPTAAQWLVGKQLLRLCVTWREDVRRWHAGQEWIWEPGGFGVFDPGINALSILTRILPLPLQISSAILSMPANRKTPIAVDLNFRYPGCADASANFDWREEGKQSWRIEVETDKGVMRLDNGGSQLFLDGSRVRPSDEFQSIGSDEALDTLRNEYQRLYQRMATLVAQDRIALDLSPLQLVADAYMLGEQVVVEPFYW